MPNATHNKPDIMCWKPSKSGKCTTKEVYTHLAHNNHDPTTHSGSRNILSQALALLTKIWKHTILQPRFKAFAWHLLRHALAGGERVGRYSAHIDKNCARYGQVETDDHLFFRCSFARAIWFAGSPSIRTYQLPLNDHGVQQQVIAIIQTNPDMQEIQRILATLCTSGKQEMTIDSTTKLGQSHMYFIQHRLPSV